MPNPRFHPFVRLVLCAFAVIVCVVVVGMLVVAVLGGTGLIAMPTSGATISTMMRSTPFAVAVSFSQASAMLAAVFLCRRFLDTRSVASLGLRMRNLPQFFSGAFCGLLAIGFLFGLLWIGGHVQVTGLSQRAQEIGPNGIALRFVVWALIMLGVGLSEEIVCRGYALHNLSAWLGNDKTGLGAAAIMQAILFGLVHMSNLSGEQSTFAFQALPNLILIGLFFALCAFKTGSLWFPIGFHAAWNFFLGSVFSLPVSGFATFRLLETEVSGSRWLTGGAFGAEGSLLLTIIIIVMIYVIRQAPDHPQFIGDVASLQPAYEPDEIEVASRAPSLRERKEQRRVQTQTTSSFEGWNDLAPPQRQRYSTYQPQQPSSQTAEQATAQTPLAHDAFPANVFAQDAPLETVASAPPLAPTETDFADYRPPVSVTEPTPDFGELVPPVAETKPETPSPVSHAKPEAPTPNAPPKPETSIAPPVKKPPSPRW